jgi:ribonuclease BN (tRNA processing enzyme)
MKRRSHGPPLPACGEREHAGRIGVSTRLTIVGSGDAFGSGGRFNACFQVESAKATILIDCGASSLVALRARGIDPNRLDGVILSHLHGDHFGGLPFLLMDAQHLSRRRRPFLVAGPPGTRARLDAALELFFPRSAATKWRFSFEVVEIEPGQPRDLLGHRVVTAEVEHQSGAPSTAVRLSDGSKTLAYSGDTEWTDALLPIADGADLLIIECSGYAGRIPWHLTWQILKSRLSDLRARQIMITHMNPAVLAHLDEIRAAGVLIAADGGVVDL